MVGQHRGFSLIELMITVMILGLLMLVGVPFTAGWIHSAQVNEVRALVVQGYGQAKAAAVRNPLGQQGTEPSASLKLVTDDDGNATLLVCAGEPEDDECDIGGGRVTWQTGLSRGTEPKLREGIAVTLNDDNNGIIEFDSVGLPNNGTDYSVTKGEESVEGDLRSDKLHPD
jgi:prepilin-type N-terminal cleavage/methylation domain-containing protein